MLRNNIEKAIFVLVALLLSGALWRALSSGGEGGIDGDSRTQAVLACVYAILAILAAMEVRRTAASLYRNPALIGLLLLAGASPLWSESPDLVLRRAVALGGTTLFGIILGTRCSFDEQLRILRWAFRITAVATLALLLVSPSRAFPGPGGGEGFRGVFTHKNVLGAAMALAFLVECHLHDQSDKAKIARLLSLGAFAGLLFASDSITSMVTVIATLGGIWIVRVACARHGVPLFAITAFGVLAGLAVTVAGAEPGDLLPLVGRSSDMTGRVELWNAVVSAIRQKPILGFGFSGFWMGASSGSETVHQQILWTPLYSHNGYLEITLNLGLVGLILAITLLANGFKRAWTQGRTEDSRLSFWPLALFLFVAIHNTAECSIVWQNCLEWSVCVATLVGCDPRRRVAFENIEETPNAPVPEWA
jgi:O-antigen ligase